jgi:hypothetical protein
MDKNVFYGILSFAIATLCFLNRIIWKDQVAYRKTEFYLWYAIILGAIFIIGGFYILLYKPYS